MRKASSAHHLSNLCFNRQDDKNDKLKRNVTDFIPTIQFVSQRKH